MSSRFQEIQQKLTAAQQTTALGSDDYAAIVQTEIAVSLALLTDQMTQIQIAHLKTNDLLNAMSHQNAIAAKLK